MFNKSKFSVRNFYPGNESIVITTDDLSISIWKDENGRIHVSVIENGNDEPTYASILGGLNKDNEPTVSEDIKDEYIGEYKIVNELTDKGYEYCIDEYGDKCWYLEGKLHRLDGPAIELASGNKFWYLEGKLHRLDGPALEFADGTKYWYVEDKRHRIDGPAVEHHNGDVEYWYDDKRLDEYHKPPRDMRGKKAVDYLLK